MPSQDISSQGQDRCESIQEFSEFNKPVHRQMRYGYDFHRSRGLRRHPSWQQVCCTIRSADKHVEATIMLVTAQNDEALPCQRVERVSTAEQNQAIVAE
jgi:hypothetical protein